MCDPLPVNKILQSLKIMVLDEALWTEKANLHNIHVYSCEREPLVLPE